MLYSDALYYAKRGYKVRRACWRKNEMHAYGVRNEAGVGLRYVGECASRGDMTATDWNIARSQEQTP